MTNKFELEHIGINTENTKEAEELAALLSSIFNLTARHGQKSEFAGDYFECMRSPFLWTYRYENTRFRKCGGGAQRKRSGFQSGYSCLR